MLNLPEQLQNIVNQVEREQQLTNLQEIYRGTYYTPNHLRNVIFSCTYQNHPAILKVYFDPRDTQEPTSLAAFHLHNRSNILTAPKLFASQQLSANSGWLIMEKLPENAIRFENQMSPEQRTEFLNLFLEYRQNFPTENPNAISLGEHLNSTNYHLFRLAKWFELANHQNNNFYQAHHINLTDPKILTKKLQHSLSLIREVFLERPMIWSHGHFKNHELFKVSNQKYYLIDFAHTKMYPQGYEMAFIIWADYLMSDNWQTLASQAWLDGVIDWLKETTKIAKQLGYPKPQQLMQGALLERTWGTILADVLAAEKPLEEKKRRLHLLYQLVDYLIAEI